jgi:hypothetical protein
MKKVLLLTSLLVLIGIAAFSQTDKFWSANQENPGAIITDKAVARLSYPKDFKLFNLNAAPFRQELFAIVGNNPLSTARLFPCQMPMAILNSSR